MRAFWIVLDSAGIGNAPDAEAFGDEGSNTWKTCYDSGKLHIPNMEKLGIYNIDEMNYGDKSLSPIGCYGRLHEKSMGKDTTIGHWEMAGMISPKHFRYIQTDSRRMCWMNSESRQDGKCCVINHIPEQKLSRIMGVSTWKQVR